MNMKKLPLKAVMAITLSGLLLAACDDTRVRISSDSHGYSGPRHHGGHITRTPHNHRVSFDAALGMYIVLGLANTYWNNGHYYRYHGSNWQRSADYRRWSRMQHNHVPSKLYKRHRRPTTYHNNKRVRIVKPNRNRNRTRPNVHWIY